MSEEHDLRSAVIVLDKSWKEQYQAIMDGAKECTDRQWHNARWALSGTTKDGFEAKLARAMEQVRYHNL